MEFVGTRQAAKRLRVNPAALSKAVWEGRVEEPLRGPGNVRLWSEEDLQKAAWAMCGKSLDDIDAEGVRL